MERRTNHPSDSDNLGRSLWIDFKGADGMRYALPYRDLWSVEMPSPQEVVLHFSNRRVVVRGRNLRPVYDDVLKERATTLAEDDMDWASESETFISKLSIERIQE